MHWMEFMVQHSLELDVGQRKRISYCQHSLLSAPDLPLILGGDGVPSLDENLPNNKTG